jgi:hypothetical protein
MRRVEVEFGASLLSAIQVSVNVREEMGGDDCTDLIDDCFPGRTHWWRDVLVQNTLHGFLSTGCPTVKVYEYRHLGAVLRAFGHQGGRRECLLLERVLSHQRRVL